MKFAIVALLASTSAFACFDPSVETLKPEAIQVYTEMSQQFAACVEKLENAGVDMDSLVLLRKDREEGDLGPVVTRFKIEAQSADGEKKIVIEQRIGRGKKAGFFCEEGVEPLLRTRGGDCF